MTQELAYLSQIVKRTKGDTHIGTLAHKVLYGNLEVELPKITRRFNLFINKNNTLVPFFGTDCGDEIRPIVIEQIKKGTSIEEFLLISENISI